jgi:hypothetical protein
MGALVQGGAASDRGIATPKEFGEDIGIEQGARDRYSVAH